MSYYAAGLLILLIVHQVTGTNVTSSSSDVPTRPWQPITAGNITTTTAPYYPDDTTSEESPFNVEVITAMVTGAMDWLITSLIKLIAGPVTSKLNRDISEESFLA